jgi:hypothetical protein
MQDFNSLMRSHHDAVYASSSLDFPQQHTDQEDVIKLVKHPQIKLITHRLS